MEKKYLEAQTTYGKIMFDNVKNYVEQKDSSGKVIHFEFDDQDGHYSYTYRDLAIKCYVEDTHRSPAILNFKIVGRRTALKHNMFEGRSQNYNPFNVN